MKKNKKVIILSINLIFLTFTGCIKDDIKLENITLVSNAEVKVAYNNGKSENIKIDPPLITGEERKIKIKSVCGHKMEFTVFGESETVPEVLITSFVTKGTKNKKDYIELTFPKGGNVEYCTVKSGKYTFTFGLEHVEKDEKITLCPNPTLSANNGSITVYSSPSPFARIIDKVVYTNKKTIIDCDKDWIGAGIDSTPSSSVKAFRRKTDESGKYIDTNSKDDWGIY